MHFQRTVNGQHAIEARKKKWPRNVLQPVPSRNGKTPHEIILSAN